MVRGKSSKRTKIKTNKNNNHIGTLEITSKGNGYFVGEDFERDIFIASENLNRAFNGDSVKIRVYKKHRSKKLEGKVLEIVKRSKDKFIGVLQINKGFGFVIPSDKKIQTDIFISKSNINGAEDGDKVLVKITDWADNSKNPFGKIINVLGKPGEHNAEIHSILSQYDLPSQFPKQVNDYAQKIQTEITKAEIKKRRDIRKELTFTIDPTDAKDFDDALSFKKLENGNYQIGIHIADVSHYVKPDTILDKQAYQRATSVYLVDRVIPMLPEVLSNGVCSLRPKEEKLTFSAIFEIDKKAQLINQWFGRTVIYSDFRFSYEEAQEIIENKNGLITEAISLTNKTYQVNQNTVDALLTLNELAKKLRKKRMNQGAISFDKLEVKFNLDKDSNPTSVYFKESKQSNKLVEEFMLLANKKVGEFIGQHKGKPTKKTFVYRVHDQPDELKISDLKNIISRFGYKINTETKRKTTLSINKLLKDVHGKKEANMIETLTIRSMSKAKYTTENIGHYGLAFDYYSHFTSPIRRYPDVMTHRLLQHYLNGNKSLPKNEIFEQKCKHCSKMEEIATKAERESIKYMQVKYMQNHQEENFEGIVSGVTEWGIYVEIKENKCEGMVRIKDIEGDYYTFDQRLYAVVGRRTKNIIQLGDQVEVRVKKADLEDKRLEFFLIQGWD